MRLFRTEVAVMTLTHSHTRGRIICLLDPVAVLGKIGKSFIIKFSFTKRVQIGRNIRQGYCGSCSSDITTFNNYNKLDTS